MRFVVFTLVAVGFLGFMLWRGKNVASKTGVAKAAQPSRRIGVAGALAFLIIGFMPSIINASADTSSSATTTTTGKPVDASSKEACPNGILGDKEFVLDASQDPSLAFSVTPAIPEGDPEAAWQAMFGAEGYACNNANFSAAATVVQPGVTPIVAGETLNDVADSYRKNHDQWLLGIRESAKRFSMTWQPDWQPAADEKNPDHGANFLISLPSQTSDQPSRLAQKFEPVPKPVGVYTFSDVYGGEFPLLKDVVLEAGHGWLTLPYNQKFPDVPECEPLGTPLFPSDLPAQQPDKTQPGSPNHQGSSGDQDNGKKNHGGGDSGTNSGAKAKGSGGGGGGAASNGGNSGGGGSNGGQDGSCSGGCAGNGPGPGPGPGTCNSGCPGTSSPPVTHPPTTKPPGTTVPKTTVPTTTSPPRTTTTSPPRTTTTSPPRTTVPPTTRPPKSPDPGLPPATTAPGHPATTIPCGYITSC